MIPSGLVDATERLPIVIEDADYDDILAGVYKVLGCANIKNKNLLPQLSYQLQGGTLATCPVCVFSEASHLDDLIADCRTFVDRKKTANPPPSVKLLVDSHVRHTVSLRYLTHCSFCIQWLAEIRKRNTKKGGSAKGKKAAPKKKTLNFDVSDDDASTGSDGDDNGGGDGTDLSGENLRIYTQLKIKYFSCVLCKGKKQLCILVGSVHLTLTWQQLRHWALALVRSFSVLVAVGYSQHPAGSGNGERYRFAPAAEQAFQVVLGGARQEPRSSCIRPRSLSQSCPCWPLRIYSPFICPSPFPLWCSSATLGFQSVLSHRP